MREMFCRECHASVNEEYYYVHMHWHSTHDRSKIMACPTCHAAVESDSLMAHLAWHDS